MDNFRELKNLSRVQFVLLYTVVISIPLVVDYYIIKYFMNSFTFQIDFTELLIVWVICFVLSFLMSIYVWKWFKKHTL